MPNGHDSAFENVCTINCLSPMQYVANQLKEQQPFDLGILTELIKTMSVSLLHSDPESLHATLGCHTP